MGHSNFSAEVNDAQDVDRGTLRRLLLERGLPTQAVESYCDTIPGPYTDFELKITTDDPRDSPVESRHSFILRALAEGMDNKGPLVEHYGGYDVLWNGDLFQETPSVLIVSRRTQVGDGTVVMQLSAPAVLVAGLAAFWESSAFCAYDPDPTNEDWLSVGFAARLVGLRELRSAAGIRVFDGAWSDAIENPAPIDGHVWPQADGSLWYGASNPLHRRAPDGSVRAVKGLVAKKTLAQSLCTTADGAVWVADGEKLRGILAGTRRVKVIIPDRYTKAVAPARDGGIWVGCRGGLTHVAPDGKLAKPVKSRIGLYSLFSTSRYVVGVDIARVAAFTPDGAFCGTGALGRPSALGRFTGAAIDPEGYVWMTSYGRIFQVGEDGKLNKTGGESRFRDNREVGQFAALCAVSVRRGETTTTRLWGCVRGEVDLLASATPEGEVTVYNWHNEPADGAPKQRKIESLLPQPDGGLWIHTDAGQLVTEPGLLAEPGAEVTTTNGHVYA